MSNIWGTDHYPEFIHFVEKDQIPFASIEATKQTTRGSQVEKSFYSKVGFYKCTDPSMVHSTTYIRCSDILFVKCCSSLKNIQDSRMSSNSIYRSTKVCESSCHNNVSRCFSTFLGNKNSLSTFNQIEKIFQHIKTQSYNDHGKSHTQVVQAKLPHITSHDNHLFRPQLN